ncbi:MAG: FG-GAP repeat domain-containing protein [Aureliella sp.]
MQRMIGRIVETGAAALFVWVCSCLVFNTALGQLPGFIGEELETELKVGYAVRALDLNGDSKLDIAIVDSKRVLWLENPSWKEHVIYETPDAKFDNVCFAPHDINGDGKTDFALGADWQFGNSDSGGTIGWLEQTEFGPWKYRQIASEPTTHRMNWIDLDDNGEPWLVVAPLKGRGTRAPGFDQAGIRLLAFQPGRGTETWDRKVVTDQLHVMHNFEAADLDEDGKTDLVTASYEGVTWISQDRKGVQLKRIGAGQEDAAPKRGASEIRHGQLGTGKTFLATVEPWHGDKIVVYLQPDGSWTQSDALWQRFVLDEQLAWGHAVACANLDNDPDQELIIGVRDDKKGSEHRCGVRIYDPQNPASGDWKRQLIDPGGVAVEDLCVADLDGDGDNDIIAVGRKTHNVRIYWNQLQ